MFLVHPQVGGLEAEVETLRKQLMKSMKEAADEPHSVPRRCAVFLWCLMVLYVHLCRGREEGGGGEGRGRLRGRGRGSGRGISSSR